MKLTTPHVAARANPAYVRLLRNLLRSLKVDADALLAAAGLSWNQLSKDPQGIGYATVDMLIQASLVATQRPWIGLEVGSAADPSTHGQVGSAVLASSDLRQALETFVRFACLRSDYFEWRFSAEPGGAALNIRERIDLGPSREFLNDLLFSVHIRIIETVIGHPAETLVVDVPREQPPWVEEFTKRCSGKLRFGAATLTFHVPDALLGLPCVTSDGRAYESAFRECEALLAAFNDSGSAQQVRTILLTASAVYPTLVEVAARLHVTPQTLMRRLKREACTYQKILDEVRSSRALWYLQNTKLSVEEIAARLGYVDTSNFSRTVRRWFGISPLEIRSGAVINRSTSG